MVEPANRAKHLPFDPSSAIESMFSKRHRVCSRREGTGRQAPRSQENGGSRGERENVCLCLAESNVNSLDAVSHRSPVTTVVRFLPFYLQL